MQANSGHVHLSVQPAITSYYSIPWANEFIMDVATLDILQ